MCLLAANDILPHLGPLPVLPQIHLLDLRGHFEVGERWGKERRQRNRREGENIPGNKFLVMALIVLEEQ